MTTYSARKTIDAPPETVWKLLTDAASYREWNPTIVSLDGPIVEGEIIRLVSKLSPKRTFKLRVVVFDAPHRMVWSDGMPFGLFKGIRTYTLQAQGEGQTEFLMEEVFSGLLEPLISKSIPDMTESFDEFAEGLKRGAEAVR